MEFTERNGLLIKLTVVILAAAVIMGRFPARPAEAFDPLGELLAEIAQPMVEEAMDALERAAASGFSSVGRTYLHEAMLQREMYLRYLLEQSLYNLDHAQLQNNGMEEGLRGFLGSFYGLAPLLTDPGFEMASPGYRDLSAGPVIFSDKYADRMRLLLERGMAKLSANGTMGRSSPVGPAKLRSMHDILIGAGEYLKNGYRGLTQAESLIHTMSNRQASVLRAMETERNDAVISYAINERQEKADKAAAFEQAVKQWNVLEPNPGY